MKKLKNCAKCKYVFYKEGPRGRISGCKKGIEIAALSTKELMESLRNGTCKFMEEKETT